jgi:hypothetical protein
MYFFDELIKQPAFNPTQSIQERLDKLLALVHLSSPIVRIIRGTGTVQAGLEFTW